MLQTLHRVTGRHVGSAVVAACLAFPAAAQVVRLPAPPSLVAPPPLNLTPQAPLQLPSAPLGLTPGPDYQPFSSTVSNSASVPPSGPTFTPSNAESPSGGPGTGVSLPNAPGKNDSFAVGGPPPRRDLLPAYPPPDDDGFWQWLRGRPWWIYTFAMLAFAALLGVLAEQRKSRRAGFGNKASW